LSRPHDILVYIEKIYWQMGYAEVSISDDENDIHIPSAEISTQKLTELGMELEEGKEILVAVGANFDCFEYFGD